MPVSGPGEVARETYTSALKTALKLGKRVLR